MNKSVTLFVSNGRNVANVVRDAIHWAKEDGGGLAVRKIVLVCLPGEEPFADTQAMADEHSTVLTVRRLSEGGHVVAHLEGPEDGESVLPADDADGRGVLIVANGGTTRLNWALSYLYHDLRTLTHRRDGEDDARMLIAIDCQRDGTTVLASARF